MREFLKEYCSDFQGTRLKYDVLKNMLVGKAVIKEAVNRWEKLGFLDGIKDEDKIEQVAVAFDNIATDLVNEYERVSKIEDRYNFNSSYKAEFNVIVFPMLRRIICKVDNFDYDKFLEFLEQLSFIAINYEGYDFDCDVEAEFCAMVSLWIEERFNNLKEKK
jgi:hypothetical protein